MPEFVNNKLYFETGKETTEEFTTNNGQKFEIKGDSLGLFNILMRGGGVAPKLCEERFTNYKGAKKALEDYLDYKNKLTPKKNADKEI